MEIVLFQNKRKWLPGMHFMFWGRFGVCQAGTEEGLCSTLQKTKVRQQIGRQLSIQPVCRRSRRIGDICIKQGSELWTPIKKIKLEFKKFKIYRDWCPKLGLSNGTTLRWIQSGRTVPLPELLPQEQQIMSRAADLAVLCSTKKSSGFTNEWMKETCRETYRQTEKQAIKVSNKTKCLAYKNYKNSPGTQP
jgi:hypothetical protein